MESLNKMFFQLENADSFVCVFAAEGNFIQQFHNS